MLEISTLPAGIYDGLPKLEELYLESNKELRCLPVGLFSGLAGLEKLTLNDTPKLTCVPADMPKIKDIEGGPSAICDTSKPNCDAATMKNLTCKDLIQTATGKEVTEEYCAYVRSDQTGPAPNLKLFKGQGITGIHECAFSFPGLNQDGLELTIADNQIKTVPVGLFAFLPSLTKLYLSDNPIKELPVKVFSGLSKLEVLSSGMLEISTLPAGIYDGLPKLEELYLESNKELRCLPVGLFSGLAGLEKLTLNDTPKLTCVPADMPKIKDIEGGPSAICDTDTTCTTASIVVASDDASTTPIIIGVLVGLVVLLAMSVAVFVIMRCRRAKASQAAGTDNAIEVQVK